MSNTKDKTIYYTNEEHVEAIADEAWADWACGLPKCSKTGDIAKYTAQVVDLVEYDEIPF